MGHGTFNQPLGLISMEYNYREKERKKVGTRRRGTAPSLANDITRRPDAVCNFSQNQPQKLLTQHSAATLRAPSMLQWTTRNWRSTKNEVIGKNPPSAVLYQMF